MTSYQRRWDVITSHRRRFDVILDPLGIILLEKRKHIHSFIVIKQLDGYNVDVMR